MDVPLNDMPWWWKALASFVLGAACLVVLHESPSFHRESTEAADPDRIDINFASDADLRTLPGVGPSLARAIIAARPYSKPEDLDRVKGISSRMVRQLRPLIKATAGRRSADRM